jgi:hypothetical protein
VFFPESDDGIGHEQKQDDPEIRPVPRHRREDHRHFDHPRHRTPEITEEFQDLIGLLLLDALAPYWASRFCASASVRPSGDDRSLPASQGIERDFRASSDRASLRICQQRSGAGRRELP